MTRPQCWLFAFLLCLPFAGSAHAQIEAGFLGKRYADASLFIEDLRHGTVSNGLGLELHGNIPLTSYLDASANISYEKFNNYSISDQRIGGSLIGYADLDTWKPFLELTVANTNQSSTVEGVKYTSSKGYWTAGAGIEAPVTRSTAIFGLAARSEYFDRKLASYWTYKFGVNTWFTQKIGGVLAVSFFKNESITYSVGVAYRF